MFNLFKIYLFLALYLLFSFSLFNSANANESRIAPLAFIENKGQWGDDVLFRARASNMIVWILNDALQFDILRKIEKFPVIEPVEYAKLGDNQFEVYSFRMSFLNANTPHLCGELQQDAYYNYFYGDKRLADVKSYERIRLKGIYDGIDVVLSYSGNNLRYDFVVLPGADPSMIRIRFDGAEPNLLNPSEIKLSTPLAEIIHTELLASQFSESGIKPVGASFFFDGGGSLGINIEQYNDNETLLIDPIIFCTYLGGNNYDHGRAIAIDSRGRPVIAGYTSSTDFPSTKGVFEPIPRTLNGLSDVFVSKFDSLGKNLLFSTFIGGELDDYAEDIALDEFGNIYITGYTSRSGTFPTTDSAYQRVPGGGYDAIAVKLQPDGKDLIYSTLFGGPGDDFGQSIALDMLGNAYITGYSSGTFITTPNAFMRFKGGKNDGFVVKFNRTGKNISYSTYLGGAEDDFAQSIYVDENGSAYITGMTRSKDFPITPNTFSSTISDVQHLGSTGDAFVSAIVPDGTALSYSTFLGGSESDGGYGITLDRAGAIYVTGYTESRNFPTTQGAFSRKYNNSDSSGGKQDIFVSKFTPSGSALEYSTYIGGYNSEVGKSILVDDIFCAYIFGTSFSYNFPTTKNAERRFINREDTLRTGETSNSDAVLVKLSPNGGLLWYSSFFGGSGSDIGNDFTQYDDGSIYLVGTTFSDNLPVTDSAFSRTFSSPGKSDAFVARMTLKLGVEIDSVEFDICDGDSVYIRGSATGAREGVQYLWTPAEGIANTSLPATYAKPKSSIVYTLWAVDGRGNIGSGEVTVNVHPIPMPEIIGPDSALVGQIIKYSAIVNLENKLHWSVSGGILLSPADSAGATVLWTDSASGSLKLQETSKWNCTGTDFIEHIRISKPHKTIIHSPDSAKIIHGIAEICEGDSIMLDAGNSFDEYRWSNGERTSAIFAKTTGEYWVEVTDSLGSGYSDTVKVIVYAMPEPRIIGPLVCPLGSQAKYKTDYKPGNKYRWFVVGGIIQTGADSSECTIFWNDSTAPSITVMEETVQGCIGIAKAMNIKIGKNFKPVIEVIGSTSICNGDSVILDAGFGFLGYQWSDGTRTRFNTIKKAGFYWVAVRDNSGFAGMSDTVSVTVLPRPPKPRIRKSGATLTCFDNSNFYQWYYYDDPIVGANEKTYEPGIDGVYSVEVKGVNECRNRSDTVHWGKVSFVEANDTDFLSIYPNPTDGNFIIEAFFSSGSIAEIEIINILGVPIFHKFENISNGRIQLELSLEGLPSGLYIAFIKKDNKVYSRKIIFDN